MASSERRLWVRNAATAIRQSSTASGPKRWLIMLRQLRRKRTMNPLPPRSMICLRCSMALPPPRRPAALSLAVQWSAVRNREASAGAESRPRDAGKIQSARKVLRLRCRHDAADFTQKLLGLVNGRIDAQVFEQLAEKKGNQRPPIGGAVAQLVFAGSAIVFKLANDGANLRDLLVVGKAVGSCTASLPTLERNALYAALSISGTPRAAPSTTRVRNLSGLESSAALSTGGCAWPQLVICFRFIPGLIDWSAPSLFIGQRERGIRHLRRAVGSNEARMAKPERLVEGCE